MSVLFDQKRLPLKKRQHSIAGIKSAYWEGGVQDAPPLILLHGLNGSHHGLMPLAQRLQAFHVFMPDLPGHGASDLPPRATVDDVVGWFDKFIRKISTVTGQKPTIIAHSFGSQIAYMSCLQLPGEYEKCVLLTPVPRVSILPYVFGRSLALLPKRLALDLVGSSEQARYFRGTFLLHRRTPETFQLMRWISDQSASTPDKFAYYVALSQELMDIPAYNRGGAQSGLFYCIAGDSDRMLTTTGLSDLKQIFGPHFYICEDTGHLMPIEAPDDTYAILRTLITA